MKINKKFKIENLVVDQDDPREALRFIYLDDKNLVVTNGHYLISVPVERSADDENNILIDPVAFKIARQIQKNKKEPNLFLFANGVLDVGSGVKVPLKKNDEQDVKYPNYKAVYPEDVPEYTIAFNGEYFQKVMNALGTTKLKLSFYGETKPIKIECNDLDENGGLALLMPIRMFDN